MGWGPNDGSLVVELQLKEARERAGLVTSEIYSGSIVLPPEYKQVTVTCNTHYIDLYPSSELSPSIKPNDSSR